MLLPGLWKRVCSGGNRRVSYKNIKTLNNTPGTTYIRRVRSKENSDKVASTLYQDQMSKYHTNDSTHIKTVDVAHEGRHNTSVPKRLVTESLTERAFIAYLSSQKDVKAFPSIHWYGAWLTKAHPTWLRDNCRCPRCVDPSTSQRLFQSADIPNDITAEVGEQSLSSIQVIWQNDISGYGEDHISTYSYAFLHRYIRPHEDLAIDGLGGNLWKARFDAQETVWDAADMNQNIKFVEYEDYMSSNEIFLQVLIQLRKYGLVFIKNAPIEELTVEKIVERIGHLRHTFYGRTWDVKSVPQAKNVAYTNQFLGFHMDLLYMADPPGFQFLHSLKSSCEGGESMFMDSYFAEKEMRTAEPKSIAGWEHLQALNHFPQVFHYDNAGEYYSYERPVFEREPDGKIKCVNWSPPFQGPATGLDTFYKHYVSFPNYVKAAKEFASIVENPKNIYEYRMEEGDCVIFNNRRVLHARKEFDTTSGERWLKGAYLSTDEFNSRYRVQLRETITRFRQANMEKRKAKLHRRWHRGQERLARTAKEDEVVVSDTSI